VGKGDGKALHLSVSDFGVGEQYLAGLVNREEVFEAERVRGGGCM
jgi:hypothetical protein